MRAAVLGLIGAVLAVGSAGAAGCVVVAKDPQPYAAAAPVQHPELVGEVFQVTRATSRRKSEYVEARQASMLLGYDAYEIKGSAGAFIVRRDYVPGTPSVQPVSMAAGDATVRWGGKAKPQIGDRVLDGPLSDLTLIPSPCGRSTR